LQFIEDGGYDQPAWWLDAGWDLKRERGWRAPLYWERREGAWHAFTLHGLVPLEAHEPVIHLSFYEADAYARWAGARLPTEAEWEAAAAPHAVEGNLLEGGLLHPRSARPGAAGAPNQLFGDVWEWTASAFAPYLGYRRPEGALGEYNGKFFHAGQLVLRGGSCWTPRAHVRATYRNFYPPAMRLAPSGVRLARDAHG